MNLKGRDFLTLKDFSEEEILYLIDLAGKLKDMGENVAYDQVMLAVSDFEKGNMRLSMILASMDV